MSVWSARVWSVVNPGLVNAGLVIPGRISPGLAIPGRVNPELAIPWWVNPGLAIPGRVNPGLAIPWRVILGRVNPGLEYCGIWNYSWIVSFNCFNPVLSSLLQPEKRKRSNQTDEDSRKRLNQARDNSTMWLNDAPEEHPMKRLTSIDEEHVREFLQIPKQQSDVIELQQISNIDEESGEKFYDASSEFDAEIQPSVSDSLPSTLRAKKSKKR